MGLSVSDLVNFVGIELILCRLGPRNRKNNDGHRGKESTSDVKKYTHSDIIHRSH